MSELINNSSERKKLLKHMILQLHEGVAPETVNKQLVDLLAKIPYGEVVEVEQELIEEGLPETEVLRLCDVHTQALEGHIDLSGVKIIPAGHPVDTFRQENHELEKVIAALEEIYDHLEENIKTNGVEELLNLLKSHFNSLMDVDKHYRRKENLVFPYLEKYGITGPPTVMWGKHDETRDLLKNALNALNMPGDVSSDLIRMKVDMYLKPASQAIRDMIMKEQEILFPMTLDKLTDSEWYDIYRQTGEIGYCLYDPKVEWKPQGVDITGISSDEAEGITLPSGKFTAEELMAILNTLPVDLTFVDRNDKVKYFSQGKERIFDRNRAILGRDVRMCHPPSSVHVVEQILEDFKSGKADSSPFWINMKGKFIHIEYFALRNEKGEYLGTLEVSQDLTEKRELSGDQRLLSYRKNKEMSNQKKEEEMKTPRWFDPKRIRITLDARPMLMMGEHPLELVMKETAAMKSGDIYTVITPFPPVPMIEKMNAAGFQSHSIQPEPGLFHTYFCREER